MSSFIWWKDSIFFFWFFLGRKASPSNASWNARRWRRIHRRSLKRCLPLLAWVNLKTKQFFAAYSRFNLMLPLLNDNLIDLSAMCHNAWVRLLRSCFQHWPRSHPWPVSNWARSQLIHTIGIRLESLARGKIFTLKALCVPLFDVLFAPLLVCGRHDIISSRHQRASLLGCSGHVSAGISMVLKRFKLDDKLGEPHAFAS